MASQVPQLLLLGFAYSMRDDGSPGSYNEELARILDRDVAQLTANGIHVWIGIQWEVYDALTVISPSMLPPHNHVAASFEFSQDHILRPGVIAELLIRCPTRAHEILWDTLEFELTAAGYQPAPGLSPEKHRRHLVVQSGLSSSDLGAAKFALCFNRILSNRTFYEALHEKEDGHVVRRVELHDYYRLRLGPIGVEKRRLPDPKGPLQYYHTRRVNRLILEAVLTGEEPLIKDMEYLSTHDGVNKYLQQLEEDHPRIRLEPPQQAIIYGHPEHRSRCKRQFLEAAWTNRWDFKPTNVHLGGQGAAINVGGASVTLDQWAAPLWDASSAQIWCRSLRNWTDYESMGNLRLH
jgi:hypothetical protein